MTALPDQISVDPNPEEEQALKYLRKVVMLLEKENEQFKRDCESKTAYQNKQKERLKEDNERLRMKVNDVSRPKVAVLAAREESQSSLLNQVEAFKAKIEVDQRVLEDYETMIEASAGRIADCQNRIKAKMKPATLTSEELDGMGYTSVKEGATTAWVAPSGEKFRSKNEVCRAMSFVPDVKMKKKLAMLEDRVQKTLQRFNESLVVNKQLRAEIEHLRKERISFDSIQSKLEQTLQQKKAQIALAIEATNVALETRDEANKKIAYYNEELLRNQQDFDAKWRELDNEMESEEKRRRQVKKQMEEEAKKARHTDDDAAQKAQLQELTAKYEAQQAEEARFEEAYLKLQEATGLKDIDELVETFLEAEEQNFKLFKFVNELNQEEEKLAEEVNQIHLETQRMGNQGEEVQKKNMERKLEDELAQKQARAEELEEMGKEDSTKLRDMLKIVRRMHEELGCGRLINTKDSFQFDSSGNPIINESNMMVFLGIVEQRATELILKLIDEQANSLDDAPKDNRDLRMVTASPLGLGPITPQGSSIVKVTAPKIETEDKSGDEKSDEEEEEDGDDEDSRPMTQEELRAKMKKKLVSTREPTMKGHPAAKRRTSMSHANHR